MKRSDLHEFVLESNRIEGILGASDEELEAHAALLERDALLVIDVERFVKAVAGKPLRDSPDMNVRVGSHVAPRGGPQIRVALGELLLKVNTNAIDPWLAHVEYERLHPFLDGNGRSGRAIWAWQVTHFARYPGHLGMGFLHPAYYAALTHSRRAAPPTGEGA
jgi:hypothetical protein